MWQTLTNTNSPVIPKISMQTPANVLQRLGFLNTSIALPLEFFEVNTTKMFKSNQAKVTM